MLTNTSKERVKYCASNNMDVFHKRNKVNEITQKNAYYMTQSIENSIYRKFQNPKIIYSVRSQYCIYLVDKWASLVAQLVKNPPAMQETLARFLGSENPLKKG